MPALLLVFQHLQSGPVVMFHDSSTSSITPGIQDFGSCLFMGKNKPHVNKEKPYVSIRNFLIMTFCATDNQRWRTDNAPFESAQHWDPLTYCGSWMEDWRLNKIRIPKRGPNNLRPITVSRISNHSWPHKTNRTKLWQKTLATRFSFVYKMR